ncbi:MAG: Gfo/Idh/MocA family protein [Eubacteriales bacterium]
MNKKPKIGIYGCSRGQDYIKILNLLKDKAELTAICERKEPRLAKAKELCPPETLTFTDFDEFIKCGLDGVIICNFFHQHVPYAIKALERGVAVLCETTAASTMAEAVELVRAVERTGGKYMLAENYPFFCANQELKRVYETGKLGRVLYAEGEYIHPMSIDEMIYCSPFPEHWRSWIPKTYYLTHSLGPLMYITGEMPTTVNARSVFAPDVFEGSGRHSADAISIMLCQSQSGALFRITGTGSVGPHGNWYRVSCSRGGAETIRGDETSVRVGYNYWCVPEGEQEFTTYKPGWTSEGERAEKAGHNGGDFWVVYKFLEYITDNVAPFFDVYRAVTMSAVGILGWRSALENGREYKIPDFHNEEERVMYENDDASPFPEAKNQCVPPSSQPYEPAPRK